MPSIGLKKYLLYIYIIIFITSSHAAQGRQRKGKAAPSPFLLLKLSQEKKKNNGGCHPPLLSLLLSWAGKLFQKSCQVSCVHLVRTLLNPGGAATPLPASAAGSREEKKRRPAPTFFTTLKNHKM